MAIVEIKSINVLANKTYVAVFVDVDESGEEPSYSMGHREIEGWCSAIHNNGAATLEPLLYQSGTLMAATNAGTYLGCYPQKRFEKYRPLFEKRMKEVVEIHKRLKVVSNEKELADRKVDEKQPT